MNFLLEPIQKQKLVQIKDITVRFTQIVGNFYKPGFIDRRIFQRLQLYSLFNEDSPCRCYQPYWRPCFQIQIFALELRSHWGLHRRHLLLPSEGPLGPRRFLPTRTALSRRYPPRVRYDLVDGNVTIYLLKSVFAILFSLYLFEMNTINEILDIF